MLAEMKGTYGTRIDVIHFQLLLMRLILLQFHSKKNEKLISSS